MLTTTGDVAMEELSLFQSAFVLGCAGLTAAVLFKAAYDVYLRRANWS